MLGDLVEGMRKVVRGIGIILIDILSEVDPEVFGSLEESKDAKEKQNLNFEVSSNEETLIKNLAKDDWEEDDWTDDIINWQILTGIGPPFYLSNSLFISNFFDD